MSVCCGTPHNERHHSARRWDSSQKLYTAKLAVLFYFSRFSRHITAWLRAGTNASAATNEHIEQIAYYYAPFDTHQSRNVHRTYVRVLGTHMDVKIRDDNEIKINRSGS